jgi:hypothetical protein
MLDDVENLVTLYSCFVTFLCERLKPSRFVENWGMWRAKILFDFEGLLDRGALGLVEPSISQQPASCFEMVYCFHMPISLCSGFGCLETHALSELLFIVAICK